MKLFVVEQKLNYSEAKWAPIAIFKEKKIALDHIAFKELSYINANFRLVKYQVTEKEIVK